MKENILVIALHPNHMGICENGLISADRYFSAKNLRFQKLFIFAANDWNVEGGIKNAKLRTMINDRISPGEDGKKLAILSNCKVEEIFGDFGNPDPEIALETLIISVENKMKELVGNRLFIHLDCGSRTQSIAMSLNGLRHDSTCVYRMSDARRPVTDVYLTGDLRELDPQHLQQVWRNATQDPLASALQVWQTKGAMSGRLTKHIATSLVGGNAGTLTDVHYNQRCEVLREEFGAREKNFRLAEEHLVKILNEIFKKRISLNIQFKPEIYHRIKKFPSFWKKLHDKEIDEGILADPFGRITDCVGAKVIFYNLTDYESAVKILGNSGKFISFKGKKPLGENKKNEFQYEATHFDVKFSSKALGPFDGEIKDVCMEIQLKTIIGDAMNYVHHELVYKDFDRPQPLTDVEKSTMISDFRQAGALLLTADQKIKEICEKYDPRKPTGGKK